MKRRVVITGMGCVSPLGNNVADTWNALVAGKSGIGPLTVFDASEFPVRFAGEVRGLNFEDYMDKKEIKKFDKFSLFGVAATREAMLSAGLTDFDHERAGCAIGAGIGGFKSIEDMQEIYLKGGHRRVSPFFIPSAIINMASGIISIEYGLKGPNLSFVTACATGTHSLGMAFRTIAYGDADVMVAGGCEAAITPLAVAGFANMKALSRRNDEPERASRPFDMERDGFVMGEGGAVLVLESLDHAKARGAKILGEVVGFGMSGDAYHITLPANDGNGARRCMQAAINDAGINASDIGYINAHGTSTPAGDKLESRAIREVFGEHAKSVKVSSTKSMMGHLLGAAGAIEAMITMLSINASIIPPTINIDNQDPDCDLDYTPNKAANLEYTYGLSNSFGFGGTNASIILKKYTE